MTTIQINEQTRIIEEATKKALKSKESALLFLINAGIVKREQNHPKAKKSIGFKIKTP